MSVETTWRVLLGPILVLVTSYIIYLLRSPLGWLLPYVEQIFVMLILSYCAVFLLSVFLLRKDSKPLGAVFKATSLAPLLVGVIFALAYLGLWHLLNFVMGSSFELVAFPSLRGYESYAVLSLLLAFFLYLTFSIFGAFAEEVAYRGYIQTKISSRYTYIVGIIVSAVFFSVQHIHVFQLSWVVEFFQTQFVYVLCFGLFTGYLFFKSTENIWCVFAFHAVINIFSVSVPLVVTAVLPFANLIATTISFILITVILRLYRF